LQFKLTIAAPRIDLPLEIALDAKQAFVAQAPNETMMPRRSLDSSQNSNQDRPAPQQPTPQTAVHEGATALYQQFNRSRPSITGNMVPATTAYNTGFPGQEQAEIRRYSLTMAPGGGGASLLEQQQQQQQQQLAQQMMPHNQQIVQQMTYPRIDGTNQGFMGDMSSSLRMQGMFTGAGAGGTSFNAGMNTGAGTDLSTSESGEGQQRTGANGPNQADREEELLLNLLIARRQRAAGGEGQQTALADELVRLRMPMTTLPFVGGNPGADFQQQQQQQQRLGAPAGSGPNVFNHPNAMAPEMSGRIDRQPTRLMDARSQDMLDISGRSKRGGFDVYKYGQAMDPFSINTMQSSALSQPTKKRRTHKKKPADMPRRPLSAYNLFFSEERERILKEIEDKEGGEARVENEESKEDESNSEVDANKPKALLRPLIPSEKKRRPHRKTHGKISFQELARMVGERWKTLPEDRRKYYKELANEDMKRQKIAMEEYYAKQNATKSDSSKLKEQGKPIEEPSDITEKNEVVAA